MLHGWYSEEKDDLVLIAEKRLSHKSGSLFPLYSLSFVSSILSST